MNVVFGAVVGLSPVPAADHRPSRFDSHRGWPACPCQSAVLALRRRAAPVAQHTVFFDLPGNSRPENAPAVAGAILLALGNGVEPGISARAMANF